MNLLTKSKARGRNIVALQDGALQYVGFAAYRLEAGEQLPLDAGDNELCVVLLSGHASVSGKAPGQGAFSWQNIGDRRSVFEDKSPFALYLPPHGQAQFTALGPAQLAVCKAPCDGGACQLPARLITPDSLTRSVRGKGASTRYVCDILCDSGQAHALLVVEVRTPSGHSSSAPPHTHDQDNLSGEGCLEATCYHQVNPPQGFVFQRVYTDDRSIDQAMAVENNDLVTVPRGYRPLSVPCGYESYSLNVMAGPWRGWSFHHDPQHNTMLDL